MKRARVHIAVWVHTEAWVHSVGSHCSVGPGFIIQSIYGYKTRMYMEPVPLKYGKLATKCPWI